MRPVNISFDERIGPERLRPSARSTTTATTARPSSSGTPAGAKRHAAPRTVGRSRRRLRPRPPRAPPRLLRAARSECRTRPARAARSRSGLFGATSVAPARSSAAPRRRPSQRLGLVSIITGPAASVENSRAVGGVRSRRSNTTRVSGRSRYTSRAVSSGSSTSTVSEPTAIASTCARRYCARRLAAADVSCVRSPGARGDAAVEAGRRLQDDERPPLTHGREERLIQPDRRVALDADVDLDASGPQRGEPAAADERKRILHRRDDAPDAGGDDALGARTGAPRVRARLERAVQRRAARTLARLVERVHFRVRLAGALVRALARRRRLRR